MQLSIVEEHGGCVRSAENLQGLALYVGEQDLLGMLPAEETALRDCNKYSKKIRIKNVLLLILILKLIILQTKYKKSYSKFKYQFI